MKAKKTAKAVKRPVKTAKPKRPKPAIVHYKPRKRKSMTKPEEKTSEKVAEKAIDNEKAPTVQPMGHKNPPVGPVTGRPLADWRKDRDYEQFNPTPEK
jgi:hypothetical protein